MLHLVLADSELETIPKEIATEKAIREEARRVDKKATDLILDSNFHHREMEKLEDKKRRGRPDIVHICLISALDSPLNREGQLKIHLHTRHDKIIEIDPETRIPRSYNRFIGLMEQLFLTGGVPPSDPLLKIFDKTLQEKLEEIGSVKTFTLSERGRSVEGRDLFRDFSINDDVAIIVGGFPHGDYISDVEKLSNETVSIYPHSLNAITAVNHVIQFYEEEYGVI